MSKLQVIDKEQGTQVPFLRGMLTKSLQRSGLEFMEAYNLATEIREEFDDLDSIKIEDLRQHIIESLAEDYPDEILQRYQDKIVYSEAIFIIRSNGHPEAFSRGVFIKRLMNCAIAQELCAEITRSIHGQLVRDQRSEVTSAQLISITYMAILEIADQKSADRYLIWSDFQRGNLPLVVLIGGVPGSGKSTIATELANRLSIIRTQSTDMLREVMRAMIPKRVSPSLHDSSFNAGRSLHSQNFYKSNKEEAMVRGFEMQSDMVSVACDAVLGRAINERVSMILEGVHVRAGSYARLLKENAVVVPVMLAVLDEEKLKRHFKGRSEEAEKRAAKRYLNSFDLIWQLQTTILSEADLADIEIIENRDIEETVNEICRVVMETLHTRYRGKVKSLRERFVLSNPWKPDNHKKNR